MSDMVIIITAVVITIASVGSVIYFASKQNRENADNCAQFGPETKLLRISRESFSMCIRLRADGTYEIVRVYQ